MDSPLNFSTEKLYRNDHSTYYKIDKIDNKYFFSQKDWSGILKPDIYRDKKISRNIVTPFVYHLFF